MSGVNWKEKLDPAIKTAQKKGKLTFVDVFSPG